MRARVWGSLKKVLPVVVLMLVVVVMGVAWKEWNVWRPLLGAKILGDLE
jgi:hypothetical protein